MTFNTCGELGEAMKSIYESKAYDLFSEEIKNQNTKMYPYIVRDPNQIYIGTNETSMVLSTDGFVFLAPEDNFKESFVFSDQAQDEESKNPLMVFYRVVPPINKKLMEDFEQLDYMQDESQRNPQKVRSSQDRDLWQPLSVPKKHMM